MEKNISESYRHLSSLGLDRHLKIIQYSPGLEEHALIYAFQAMQKKYDKYDYMIFDMPPTGLALRFFNHPAMTLTWLKKLMELRKMIIEKKNIIQKIKRGDAPARTDQVYSHLRALELESGALQGLFTSKDDTRVMIVLNADYLSVKESERIQIHFQTLHIPVFGFILNKDENTTWDDAFLKTREVVKFPRNASPLLGIKAIENYLTIPGISRFLDQLCVMPSADF
ncbi:MAG: hypothetical protein E4H13_01750 [Calditrichales bacterium]|nr:MAG: hypothetical protein E4H13_01750 [Calditrichales bacterium]